MPPIPVNRFLVPEAKPSVPEGFTPVDSVVQTGLPHRIQLDPGTVLVLTVPTGLASTWRDADPMLVVSRSDDQLAAFEPKPDEPVGSLDRAPARLSVFVASAPVASVSLVAGLRLLIPDHGDTARGVRIEVVVLSWTITAGSMRGPGDFGSRISLAWRPAGRAIDQFSTPPPNPTLVKRQPPDRKMESAVGFRRDILTAFRAGVVQARFAQKKVVLR